LSRKSGEEGGKFYVGGNKLDLRAPMSGSLPREKFKIGSKAGKKAFHYILSNQGKMLSNKDSTFINPHLLYSTPYCFCSSNEGLRNNRCLIPFNKIIFCE